ncbi:hypothetical protein VNO80_21482 [Phaseolus coccineus]|uniref:Uncharacterized protein n=1 Tax=Phaseolus coccineus TaxID=3886 RepID=A0AAN9M863_PHACN
MTTTSQGQFYMQIAVEELALSLSRESAERKEEKAGGRRNARKNSLSVLTVRLRCYGAGMAEIRTESILINSLY